LKCSSARGVSGERSGPEGRTPHPGCRASIALLAFPKAGPAGPACGDGGEPSPEGFAKAPLPAW